MKLLGFNFIKINLEKKSSNLKNLKISTNITLLDIKEVKSSLFTPQEIILSINFEYLINYEPNIAFFKFQGNLLISLDQKRAEEILEKWKEKKLPEEVRLSLFNFILRKSSLKALQFEEEFNLPPHISIPLFKRSSKKKDL